MVCLVNMGRVEQMFVSNILPENARKRSPPARMRLRSRKLAILSPRTGIRSNADQRMLQRCAHVLFGRGGRIKPSWYGDCLPSRDFPMLIDLYLQGRLDLDAFVSETISLDGVEEAFHRLERG